MEKGFMKKLMSLGKDSFKGGHNKPGEGGSQKAEEGGCLGPFKGTRAGAKRHGSNKWEHYPDAPKEMSGHPGAHQA
jgi:hypothetical protein